VSAPDDKDTRTLPPTPKRIREFRKRGEIALSRDLTTAAALIGGAIGAVVSAASGFERMRLHARIAFGSLSDAGAAVGIAHHATSTLFAVVMPVAGGAFVGFLAAAAAQLGWPPALVGLKLDLTKPFGLRGLGGLVSPKAAAGRALKSALKVAFVGAAAAMALSRGWTLLSQAPTPDAAALSGQLGAVLRSLLVTAGGALGVLALVDWLQQRRSLAAKMRMTKEEMKREHRESDGDPAIRGRRRKRMRELAKRRLAAVVPTADLVLVNPTEYAVALRYRQGEDGAPRVIAKGRGGAAERIRELARSAGVPIVPEPPLCRLIHKLVPEGREIPAQLFAAVAEVLAYVYRLRGRSAS
jgi:flagellar biosynthetic protein FlhB